MSRENVAVMRRIYDEWGRGDLSNGVELFDPHVLLVIRPEFPDVGVYLGPGEIATYTRDLLASWSEFAIEAEDFFDAGDSVVVQVRQRAVGVSSGALTDARYFQVWTFRGKAIIRIESIREREQALEAVGLPE
jgi:ketosteroid isomerase-like protein